MKIHLSPCSHVSGEDRRQSPGGMWFLMKAGRRACLVLHSGMTVQTYI